MKYALRKNTIDKNTLPYYIVLSGQPDEYVLMDDIAVWCTEVFGPKDHKVWGIGYTSFYFATEEDASLFILRWT